MAEYTVIEPAQMADALARFGLPAPSSTRSEPRGAVNTGYHVWAGGHRFFLRVNEARGDAQSDLRFEAEVHAYLHQARFPVPELRVALDGRPWVEIAGKRAMLFFYAPGEELAPAAITPERCRRLGEQLGRLHELAAGFPAARPNPHGRAWVADVLRELAPTDPEAQAVLPMLRDELSFAQRLPGAPRGLVHGDVFPDNVLWIGDQVSAILDWEMSGIDPFAYDLGVAVNAWCFAGSFQAERAKALLAGYRGRRKLEPETAEALYEWSRFAALRFTVARLRGYRPPGAHGPTPAGKDWHEFRDRLALLRGMSEPEYRGLVGV